MKASELIDTLQRLTEEHGDREITVLVDGYERGSIRIAYAAGDGEDIIIETDN